MSDRREPRPSESASRAAFARVTGNPAGKAFRTRPAPPRPVIAGPERRMPKGMMNPIEAEKRIQRLEYAVMALG